MYRFGRDTFLSFDQLLLLYLIRVGSRSQVRLELAPAIIEKVNADVATNWSAKSAAGALTVGTRYFYKLNVQHVFPRKGSSHI